MFKSGFVSIVGRPNVGKSTFINQCLGKKVSIVSDKPQTTRDNIRAIYTTDSVQIIFCDTPGIHKPKASLGEYMNKSAFHSLKDTDLVLLIVDALENFGPGDEFVLRMLKKEDFRVILVINKIDLVKDKRRLMENVAKFDSEFKFLDVYYISALNGTNVDKLLKCIEDNLSEGPKYYDEESFSDHSVNFIVSEIIREKVFYKTKAEIPHSCAVMLEENFVEDGLRVIRANIICERDSQKKIIIGKNGEMIKAIRQLAKRDLIKNVYPNENIELELWVKVISDWRNRNLELKRLGYGINK